MGVLPGGRFDFEDFEGLRGKQVRFSHGQVGKITGGHKDIVRAFSFKYEKIPESLNIYIILYIYMSVYLYDISSGTYHRTWIWDDLGSG